MDDSAIKDGRKHAFLAALDIPIALPNVRYWVDSGHLCKGHLLPL